MFFWLLKNEKYINNKELIMLQIGHSLNVKTIVHWKQSGKVKDNINKNYQALVIFYLFRLGLRAS